jgi:hypothetical protein
VYLRVFSSALSLLVLADSVVATTSEDHLVPRFPDSAWGVPGYYTLLQKKLFLTRADYGRVLLLQSLTGECALAVYSSGSNGAYVTCTKADEDLWQQRSSALYAVPKNPAADKRRIHITRVDAPLAISTAVAIRDALAAMLRQTVPNRVGGPIVVDGTYIEFSLAAADKTMIGAVIPGMHSKNTSELAKIAYMLKTYCTAPSDQRSALAAQIETRAKNLARNLHAK